MSDDVMKFIELTAMVAIILVVLMVGSHFAEKVA